jgi:hypothetical protein
MTNEYRNFFEFILFPSIAIVEKRGHYSGCQKNVPIAGRFFATTLMPPSFYRNILMTSGINVQPADLHHGQLPL